MAGVKPSLWDAFKQYLGDAAPGGTLNPEVTPQGLLDVAAMATAPVPGVGDVVGVGADLKRMYDNPEERTLANAGLLALGAMPLVPSGMSAKRLEDIIHFWKKNGVALDVFPSSSGKVLTLSRIEVPKAMREKGIGSKAMDDLIGYADNSGMAVALSPSTDFGASSKERLRRFYKRFGFVDNKGTNKDFSISESMYRLPREAKK